MESDEFTPEEVERLAERFEAHLQSGLLQGTYFDIDELIALAEHYEEQHLCRKVKAVIELGLQLYPNDYELKISQVRCLICENKCRSALQLLDRMQIEGDTYDADLMRMEAYLRLRYKNKALLVARRIMQQNDDDHANIALDLTDVCSSFNQHDIAQEVLTWALQADPENIKLLLRLGATQISMHLIEESIKTYNRLLDIEPYDADAWFYLAFAHCCLQEWDEAIRGFDFCLSVDNTYTDAWIQKGKIYMVVNRPEEAQKCYAEALNLVNYDLEGNPKSQDAGEILPEYLSDIYCSLGKTLTCLNQNETAIQRYQTALRFVPHYYDAYIGLALSYFQLQRYQDALNYCKQGLKHNRDLINCSRLYCLSGDVYMQLGRTDQARKMYRSAIEENPWDIDTHVFVGCAMFAQKLYRQGEKYLKAAFELNPDYAASELLMHLIGLYEDGETELALKLLDAAVRISPESVRKYCTEHPESSDTLNRIMNS
ncbi:MAG: tetratricopeptide repeat protein [Paludibacteraceae bacterium]|nr:tetratricopeptide repeat protein [Paludibacteraceae bacterium]